MKLKTVFAAAALLSLGVSTSAFADVIDAGTLPVAPAPAWTDIITHSGDGVAFTDTLNFSIAASQLTSSANSLSLSLGGDATSTISGLSYTLWDAANHEIGGVYTGNNTTYTNLLTSPGSYHFLISGTVVGSIGGYAVSLQTSAVPEPETYGMMLGGLALVGAIARRKGAKKAV
jgi:hypothetical protein